MATVNLIPEDKDLVIEWSIEWMWKLFKIMESTGRSTEFVEACKASGHNVYGSAKLANEVKQFIHTRGLHEGNRDAETVLLSAHCGCRGKSPKGG